MAGYFLMIYTRANKMKKILLTIIAGIGGFGALLADTDGIVITKTDAAWGRGDGTPHICLEEGMTPEMLENTPMPFSPRYFATMEMEGKVLLRGCGYMATFGASILEKTEEETVLPSGDERICTRIEGCGVDLNATTEEEYCPTCVWKSELKKIKIINSVI